MTDIILYGYFEDSTNKDGETGLTVTVDVHRVTKSSGAASEIVTGGSATELGDGVYLYRVASADLSLYDYPAIFKTASSTVSSKNVPALRWDGAEQWAVQLARLTSNITTAVALIIAYVDATISSRLASAAYTAPPTLAQFFTTDTGLDYSDAVDGSVVKEVLDGVPPSTLGAATLWSYATRTLTQSAIQVADAVSGATISILRGDTLTASITGLGALTDYVTLDFTVKIDKTAADTTAVIRIRKNLSGLTDGLLTLNGATASTASWGSITIDDLTTGDITITLSAAATRLLVPSNQQVPYDIQMITASAVQTMATGFANISADVTRAVS